MSACVALSPASSAARSPDIRSKEKPITETVIATRTATIRRRRRKCITGSVPRAPRKERSGGPVRPAASRDLFPVDAADRQGERLVAAGGQFQVGTVQERDRDAAERA